MKHSYSFPFNCIRGQLHLPINLREEEINNMLGKKIRVGWHWYTVISYTKDDILRDPYKVVWVMLNKPLKHNVYTGRFFYFYT